MEQTCVACGTAATAKFCPDCGERMKPRRISFGELFADYWDDVVSLDVAFLRTLKNLVKRPGQFAREYVEGNRKNFYRPVPFFLLAVALHYLATVVFMDLEDIIRTQSISDMPMYDEEQMKAFAEIQGLQEKWGKTMQAAQLPIFALFSWLLFRKRSKTNYWENGVLFMYTLGFLLLVNVLVSLSYHVFPTVVMSAISFIVFLGILAYHSWSISSFHGEVTAGLFFRGLLVTALSIVLYTSTIGIGTILYLWDTVHVLFEASG